MNILKNYDYEYIYKGAGWKEALTLDEWTHAKDMYMECCEKIDKVLRQDTNIDSFEQYLEETPEFINYDRYDDDYNKEGTIVIWFDNNDPLINEIGVTLAYNNDEPPYITNLFHIIVKSSRITYEYIDVDEPIRVLRTKKDVLHAIYGNKIPAEYQVYTVKYPNNNEQVVCNFETIKSIAATLANASEGYELSTEYHNHDIDDIIELLSYFNIKVSLGE